MPSIRLCNRWSGRLFYFAATALCYTQHSFYSVLRDLNEMKFNQSRLIMRSVSQLRIYRGFTLIELMVGLAVLAIIIVVGIPSMSVFINSNRLTAQANDLLSALQLARSEAIRLNRNIIFCNTSDAATCNVSNGNWSAWLVLDPLSNTVLQTSGVLDDELSVMSDAGISQDRVIFNAMGLARNSANLRLSQNGVIRVCSVNAAEPNFRDVVFRSGGRTEVIRPESGSGECSRPDSPL